MSEVKNNNTMDDEIPTLTVRNEDEAWNAQSPGDRHPMVAPLVILGVALWCISVMAIGVNLAESAWEWAWVLAFGTVIPAALLWQTNRLLSPPATPRSVPSDKEKEKELLQALGERGELTPITAAIQTSLTADEAAGMLEELTRKGYLSLLVEDGIQAYALRKEDRRGLPEMRLTAPESNVESSEASLPLDDPLSERELEVLTLLASGRTNSEIARDLFVTVGTIKSHTSNVYRKLGTRNRAETLTRAHDLKLLA
ncbi:MAG: response regulator transcription factor [Rubrobacteraceae bacterium]